MKAGVFLGYWPWISSEEQVSLTVLADDLGLDSAWIAEAWGQDAVSVLAVLASKTERIGLGSGLMQIPARPPASTAMAAATLDVISGGRFRLGLGVSGPQVSEGWYGVRFARPLARTREYIEVVRQALGRETVRYDGDFHVLPLPDGPGKPLKLMLHPPREHIPVYLAAIGPKNLELAGELTDGLLAVTWSPELASEPLAPVGAGRAKVGKTADAF